ncbi:MAG: TIGR01777 family oxidoreductase [Verrucomicrobiales bacterium]|nr:TIGR01777 family oxidoreductase [Verrucomicrobiota bacterium JB025]
MQAKRRVAIVGVTGFIGSGLPAMFVERGWQVTGVSRSGGGTVEGVGEWRVSAEFDPAGHEAVVNLAGAPIDKRWTEANKRVFHASRVGVTRALVDGICRVAEAERPRVLVNGSAVGYYGDGGDVVLDEQSPGGVGYLAGLCGEWEGAAWQARGCGVRVACLRTGVVLGAGGAAFEKLARVFKTGLGGKLGSGRQWMPWIHVSDLRRAIVRMVESGGLAGPVNGVAPNPERNADFTRKFAKALRRPAVLPVPGFALKLALGGFGEALLGGQRAVPKALVDDGFEFRYPRLEDALRDLVSGD